MTGSATGPGTRIPVDSTREPYIPGVYEIARRTPERTAIMEPEGQTVTFGELVSRANRLSNGLKDRGCTQGSTVAALLHNRVEYFELSNTSSCCWRPSRRVCGSFPSIRDHRLMRWATSVRTAVPTFSSLTTIWLDRSAPSRNFPCRVPRLVVRSPAG